MGKAIRSARPPRAAKTTIKERRRWRQKKIGRIRCAVLSHLCQISRRVDPPLPQTYFVCLCRLGSHVLPTQLSLLSAVRREAGVSLSSAARSPPAVRPARLKGVRPTPKIRLDEYSAGKRAAQMTLKGCFYDSI